jgi:hypothetical protein
MIFVLVVAAAMAALTWLLGWWGVLLAALVVGLVFHREGGGGWRIALAAALAWAALLAVNGAAGSLAVVMTTLGAVLRVPAAALVLLTLAFPALLAWSAATVMAEGRRLVATNRQESEPEMPRARSA